MGCGSSTPTNSEPEPKAGEAGKSLSPVPQPPPAAPRAEGAAQGADAQQADDEYDQRRQQALPKAAKWSGGDQDASERDSHSTPSSLLSSSHAEMHTPVAPQGGQALGADRTGQALSSGQGGSLGNKLDRANFMPSGWTVGKSVLVRDDQRTAHICSLAASIMKAPVVIVFSQHGGRNAASNSKALREWGERTWITGFCDWLYSPAAGSEKTLVIEDCSTDTRCGDCTWVRGGPLIRFMTSVELVRPSDSARIGFLVALDRKPHPSGGVNAAAMLSNLANMAVRELETPYDPMQTPEQPELYTLGEMVPQRLKRGLEDYMWVTLIVDITKPGWPILHVNPMFRNMTGVPPGCIEGGSFWDYFVTFYPTDEKPWVSSAASLAEEKNFYLPSLSFRSRSESGVAGNNKQIYKAEMRVYNDAASKTYEIEPPSRKGLYFACFQPEARVSLDMNSATPSVPDELPFPALELGPVIGKGSFGYVCKGALGYMIVAVKIIEAEAITKVDSEGLPLEVSLSKDLRHQNIVQMLDYATRLRKQGMPEAKGLSRRSSTSSRHTSKSSGGKVSSAPDPARPSPPPLGSTNSQKEFAVGSFMGSALDTLAREQPGSVLEAWLVMEFCDLGSLMDGIEAELFGNKAAPGKPRVPNVPAIEATAFEIAAAMRYLHHHNILHGDLTAGNVLLATVNATPDNPRGFCAKVADFGLSREALTSKVETQSYGTVTHMPPELLNDGYLSKHADVYAFGVLMVEMFLGERAFTGMRQPQIIHTIAVLNKHPELPDTAPKYLQELANACMQEDYKKRPSFEDIMDILRPHVPMQKLAGKS